MVEFLSCDTKAFRCKATSSCYRWACGFYVMNNVMLDLTLSNVGLSQCRELREKGEEGVRRVLLDMREPARCRRKIREIREETIHSEMCGRVRQSPTPRINHKNKMLQEVCTQNSLLHIGHNKHPTEGAVKTDVECAGAYTIGHNTRTINSL